MGDGTDLCSFVYVLRSLKTGRRYVGSTADVEQRLRRHNLGHSKSAKSGRPWIVVHTESFASRTEAVNRELFLKSGSGRTLLDEILRMSAA